MDGCISGSPIFQGLPRTADGRFRPLADRCQKYDVILLIYFHSFVIPITPSSPSRPGHPSPGCLSRGRREPPEALLGLSDQRGDEVRGGEVAGQARGLARPERQEPGVAPRRRGGASARVAAFWSG